MDLATATPREIDTHLAGLYAKLAKILARQADVTNDIHRALGETPHYITRNRKGWPTRDADAITQARVKAPTVAPKAPWDHYHLPTSLAAYDAAETARVAVLAEMRPYQDEYDSRRWSRFFLVTSSDGGHLHAHLNCSTCRITTEFGWNPELSGKTEPEAVKALGPLLCTVCFPSAPVEWTVGRQKPAGCAGSGKAYKDGTRRRVGMNIYGVCVECDTTQLTTQYGLVRKHKPATK